jgi:hypothetical protein
MMKTQSPELNAFAGRLYTVYCREVGGIAFNGDPLPTWDVFSNDSSKARQYLAWVAVATEALVRIAKAESKIPDQILSELGCRPQPAPEPAPIPHSMFDSLVDQAGPQSAPVLPERPEPVEHHHRPVEDHSHTNAPAEHHGSFDSGHHDSASHDHQA